MDLPSRRRGQAGCGARVALARHFTEISRGAGAQIAKDNGHLATVALQERISIARRNDEVGDLFGQEPPKPRHSLELRHLVGHGLLERAVPVGKLRGLVLKAFGLARDSVVKRLLTQHRAHPR
ncbi:hypothetical protein NKH61_09460 [Mesorhizobium sp. M1005]|uniref:hypothetical protein n=1 Tax=unclassified Mesorhizobium TaxID=325217 RepID=UPI00333AC485